MDHRDDNQNRTPASDAPGGDDPRGSDSLFASTPGLAGGDGGAIASTATSDPSTCTYAVIGGNGFLGRRLVHGLLDRFTDCVVISLDLSHTPDPAPFRNSSRIVYETVDILSTSALAAILQGRSVTLAFHLASPAHGSKDTALYYKVNVDGTRSVVQACLQSDVTACVYASSASVVFDGSNVCAGEESLPYASRPYDSYTDSKAQGEDLVLKANRLRTRSGIRFSTAAIRPSGIFGPGDRQMLPGFEKVVRQQRTDWVLGDGTNLFDFTYVDNVVEGLIKCGECLLQGKKGVAGEAFNTTNGEPIPFWSMSTQIFHGLYPTGHPKRRTIASKFMPRTLALVLSSILYFFYTILPFLFREEPTFTPFRVGLATATRYFAIDKARERLGYSPKVPLSVGIERTLEWWLGTGRGVITS